MKNYKILSLLAVVLMLALASGASSLILNDSSDDVAATSRTVTAKAVNDKAAESTTAARCGNSCVPMSPEQCASKHGVDVETMKKWMKECQNGTTTSGRLIDATGMQGHPADCNPSDCPKYPDCKKTSNCKVSKPCGGVASCKTASNCSSGNIDSSN